MSSSKSSQSSAQTYTDNRAVLGEGALYANNGASISNYVLDNGAISSAFDFADGSATRAAQLLSAVTDGAFTFGGDALATGSDALSRAFTFGGNTVDQALNFGSEALTFSQHATASALDNLQATQKLTADAYNDAKGRGAMTDKLLIGAIVAMAVVAFAAVKKG